MASNCKLELENTPRVLNQIINWADYCHMILPYLCTLEVPAGVLLIINTEIK